MYLKQIVTQKDLEKENIVRGELICKKTLFVKFNNVTANIPPE